jgi:hypothetical protein
LWTWVEEISGEKVVLLKTSHEKVEEICLMIVAKVRNQVLGKFNFLLVKVIM